ncbi:MAG: prolipoprotein diacylglyceryl transferase family protein [Dehalococcoidia bacterium]
MPGSSDTSDSVEPEALVATYSFDSGTDGEPSDITVRFTGRRVDTPSISTAGNTFTKDERIEGVIPGTGPVSITTWVYGLQPGQWNVDAELIRGSARGFRAPSGSQVDRRVIQPASWSWRRWALTEKEASPVKTRWALLAPLARQPAVMPGIYTALGIAGIVLAVVIQAAILGPWGVPVGDALIASAAAIVSGLIGAKVLYATLHPDESIIRGGWAVDGFLLVFPVVGAMAMRLLDLPIGSVLDASTPGVFLAVAIGRVGCFLTGCCAGRCTASRWGIWSSDRRVGARRVPTQLLESATGLAIAIVTGAIVLAGRPAIGGIVFVAAFVVYAVARQVLLRLRVEQRASSKSLPLTAVGAFLAVVIVTSLMITQ